MPLLSKKDRRDIAALLAKDAKFVAAVRAEVEIAAKVTADVAEAPVIEAAVRPRPKARTKGVFTDED